MATAVALKGAGKVLVEIEVVCAWDMALKVLPMAKLWVCQGESTVYDDDVL
jgi:hypothetical protein